MTKTDPLDMYRGGSPFRLIQRLQDPLQFEVDKPDPERIFDGLFRFDYMGAAEFEFGTIPSALRSMRSRFDRKGLQLVGRRPVYVAYPVNITMPAYATWDGQYAWAGGGVTFWFVSREPLGDRRAALERVFTDEYRHTKEITGVQSILAGYPDSRHVAWWSLTDDIAWALDRETGDRLAEAFNAEPPAWVYKDREDQ